MAPEGDQGSAVHRRRDLPRSRHFLAATSREEFVRDLVASLLEAAYGKPSAAAPAAGQVVPIQTAGADEAEILSHLAAETLRAVHETAGTLLAPRWIAFDEQRVTATLPVAEGASTGVA